MTPVVPSSINDIPLMLGIPFLTGKSVCLKRSNLVTSSSKQTLCSQKFILSLSTSGRLFPKFGSRFAPYRKPRATGTDLATEKADSPVSDEVSPSTSEESPTKSEPVTGPTQSKRTKPTRRSEMPPVKPEELVPGATFTGKVRSIQPFGAFVDFGAFTDGLIHVSQLSDSFVKDVHSIVSIGQEVKVRLIEANVELNRISLTMRESDDINKKGPTGKSRPPRKGLPRSREESKKTSKFVKGQDLKGTVKNLTRSGAFISLPEGEEGFLPQAEEVDEGFANMMGGSSLQVGQEVSVRVLRISRGQVTLTMKKEEAAGKLDSKLNQGFVHTATNPFLLAFRRDKDIASFLDEREKAELSETKPDEAPEPIEALSSVSTVTELIDATNPVENQEEEPIETRSVEASAPIEALSSVSAETELIEAPKPVVAQEEEPTETEPVEALSSVSTRTGLVEAPQPIEAQEEEPTDTEQIKAPEPIEALSSVSTGTEPFEFPEPVEALSTVPTETEKVEALSSVSNETESVEVPSSIPTETEPNQAPSLVDEVAKGDEMSSSFDKDSLHSVDGDNLNVDEKVEISNETASIKEEMSVSEELCTSDELPVAERMETYSVFSEDFVESQGDDDVPKDEAQVPSANVGDDVPPLVAPKDEKVEDSVEDSRTSVSSDVQVDALALQQTRIEEIEVSEEVENVIEEVAEGDHGSEETENEIDDTLGKGEIENKIPDTDTETPTAMLVEDEKVPPEETATEIEASKEVEDVIEISITPTEDPKVEPTPEDKSSCTNSVEESSVPSTNRSSAKATISPALVKQLREETGAGMMDCKKALSETEGDLVKAQEFLRIKGLASADKKASRATAEGRIGSYIHDSRIGVLIEVNCETDFVSRGDIFKELVDDLAMQVAACPQVQYLNPSDVDKQFVEKERGIEMQKEDLLSKPEQIREKIVEGRIRKRLEELALLEQPYIKNDKLMVKDWVKQTIAMIGENIKVKRFVRFNLGEGLEKKSQDFAAEVAAQTAARSMSPPAKEKTQPAMVEEKSFVVEPPKATVSAALVKQLREETGAGMMDCKKALSETGGDIEKAQEYLRKKGLSTADKKSSRLAAEGRIGSYIHDSRIGVLIEVNCETDFVGRSEKFKELVDDLAMQVVACSQVQYVSIEDIPESIVMKEKELEMQRDDLLSKPENIREKIVEGRVSKRLGELALLEQAFIKDNSILVKDLVKQTIAGLGENIKVRRFVRFTLGETSEGSKTE